MNSRDRGGDFADWAVKTRNVLNKGLNVADVDLAIDDEVAASDTGRNIAEIGKDVGDWYR